MERILINCDLGENEPDEQTAKLLKLVDAASICCGFHAGSESKTLRTLELAVKQGVLIGAHPGLPVEGGRGRSIPDPQCFRDLLKAQFDSFSNLSGEIDARVSYVKLHGNLYHAVEQVEVLAEIYLDFLSALGSSMGVFALAGGAFQKKAKAAGLMVYEEIFADRGYRPDGSLVPRFEDGALLNAHDALSRFQGWTRSCRMDTTEQGKLVLNADTVCVHSDSPEAETLLAGLRNLVSI